MVVRKMFKELVPLKLDEQIIVRHSGSEDYPYHIHDEYELFFCRGLTGIRFVGNHIGEFSESDIAMCGPNLPHKWKFLKEEKKYELLVLQFRKELFENELFYTFSNVYLPDFIGDVSRGIRFRNKKIYQQVETLILEIEEAKKLERLILFYQLINILQKEKDVEILSGKNYEKPILSKGANATIDSVYDYLTENYKGDLNLDEMAGKFNFSKPGFCIFFKKHTGKTFSVFMNELRLSQCCKLLIESDKNITEICFSSGFNNLSYFNRKFIQFYGISPSEYRKLYK